MLPAEDGVVIPPVCFLDLSNSLKVAMGKWQIFHATNGKAKRNLNFSVTMHLTMKKICPTSQTHCKPKHQQTGHEHCHTKLIALIINQREREGEEVSFVKLGCCKSVLKRTKI